MVTTFLQVALGGAAGAMARYGLGLAFGRWTGPGIPLAVLTCNVVGSFAMGLFVVLAAQKGLTHLSPLIMTGLLGGFTTFSAFSLETVTLIERGQAAEAALYVGLSVVLSIGGLWLGVLSMRALLV
ncbi:fluoride efflux transporter CrcB [Rhodobacteraceae bacterium CCMM004]|nr:fluoride efflux transporter CrcB [Rhodobacteraceae bacterium CCMM004]